MLQCRFCRVGQQSNVCMVTKLPCGGNASGPRTTLWKTESRASQKDGPRDETALQVFPFRPHNRKQSFLQVFDETPHEDLLWRECFTPPSSPVSQLRKVLRELLKDRLYRLAFGKQGNGYLIPTCLLMRREVMNWTFRVCREKMHAAKRTAFGCYHTGGNWHQITSARNIKPSFPFSSSSTSSKSR